MDSVIGLFAIFTTPAGWLGLLTLMFLEIVLGIDNLVFIAITSDRLPREKQHIGRRLGLLGAMIMRCILLCCIVWLMSFDQMLVRLPFGMVAGTTPISARSLIFLVGGAYLVYKGISELHSEVTLADYRADSGEEVHAHKLISLPRAVITIMFMDIVFSLDSVITAAGLSGMIVVMCLAVIIAVIIMMVFADAISDFINENPEVKIVALTFIFLIGALLLLEGFSIDEIEGVPLNITVYCMMAFGLVVSLLIMTRNRRLRRFAQEHHELLSDEGVEKQASTDDRGLETKEVVE